MQWIKYQIVQSIIDEETILIEKKVGYSEANLAIAQAEAYNGEYTIEEDGITINKKPIAIEFGGTGADNAEDALIKLGAAKSSHTHTPADIGAAASSHTHSEYLSKSAGGTVSGAVIHNAKVTFNKQIVLSSDSYGATLPPAGTKGRIFFKKL